MEWLILSGLSGLTHDRGVFPFVFCVETRGEGYHFGFSLYPLRPKQLARRNRGSFSFERPRLFTLDCEKYAIGPGSDEENIIGLFCLDDIEKIRWYVGGVDGACGAVVRNAHDCQFLINLVQG